LSKVCICSKKRGLKINREIKDEKTKLKITAIDDNKNKK